MSTTANSETNFKPVDNQTSGNGVLNIIRPSKLTDADVNAVVALGIYEGSIANQFNAAKLDYKVRAADGSLTILNSSPSLARQMELVSEGEVVRITYLGKAEIKKGIGKGKLTARFLVEREDSGN